MPTSSYTFKILLEGKDAVSAARRIRAELQRELSQGFDLRKEMANIGTEAQTTAGRMAQMERELQGATRQSGRLEVDLRDADDATRRLVNDFFQGKINADQLEQSLRGSSQAVQATRQEVKWLGRDLQEVAQMGRMERFGAAMTAAAQQTYGLRTLAGGLGRVGTGMMTTGAAIVGPLTLAGRSYLEFSADAGQAARQLKLNAELTDELKSKTLDLSASLGLFTPEEISSGLYTWASAIGAVAESEKDLDKLLADSTEVQKLAAMNQEQLGTTTEFVAAILGEFNLETSQTKRVVALLNYTADRTQATVSDLGESLKFVGPIAATLGEDVEDVAAALGVAADAGIKASMAGRATRQLYISLTKPTKEMNKAFNAALGLSGELGQSWQDIVFQGGKFIGTAATIDLLAASTENLTDQQRMALLAHLATANELPVLTALVMDQIAARKEGINSMRAWKKQAEGTIDAEVQAYARWREATKGVQVSQEDMFESWEREWQTYEEEDHARADRVTARWNAAWKSIGKAATESALPALEKLADLMDEIGRYAEEHPATVKAILESGALLIGVGALVKAASSGIRLYADWQMIGAAATMLRASENMLQAAGLQATTGTNLLGGMGKLVGPLARIAIALTAEKYIVEKAGVPEWMQTQTARGTETYEEYVKATQEITQGRLEVLTRAQWEAVHAGQELKDVLEKTGDRGTIATHDIAEEMRSLKEYERQAKREAKDLGNELMQLPRQPSPAQWRRVYQNSLRQSFKRWTSWFNTTESARASWNVKAKSSMIWNKISWSVKRSCTRAISRSALIWKRNSARSSKTRCGAPPKRSSGPRNARPMPTRSTKKESPRLKRSTRNGSEISVKITRMRWRTSRPDATRGGSWPNVGDTTGRSGMQESAEMPRSKRPRIAGRRSSKRRERSLPSCVRNAGRTWKSGSGSWMSITRRKRRSAG